MSTTLKVKIFIFNILIVTNNYRQKTEILSEQKYKQVLPKILRLDLD